MLSALIWVGWLLLLEYALPLRAYSTLLPPWPAQDAYSDQVGRLEQVRTKHLLCGGFHPIGEMIELRAYRKSIAKREGARANLA